MFHFCSTNCVLIQSKLNHNNYSCKYISYHQTQMFVVLCVEAIKGLINFTLQSPINLLQRVGLRFPLITFNWRIVTQCNDEWGTPIKPPKHLLIGLYRECSRDSIGAGHFPIPQFLNSTETSCLQLMMMIHLFVVELHFPIVSLE